jgi:hypothetical protein
LLLHQRKKKQECGCVEFHVARREVTKWRCFMVLRVDWRLCQHLHGCNYFCTNKQWPHYECRRGQPGKHSTCNATRRITPCFGVLWVLNNCSILRVSWWCLFLYLSTRSTKWQRFILTFIFLTTTPYSDLSTNTRRCTFARTSS